MLLCSLSNSLKIKESLSFNVSIHHPSIHKLLHSATMFWMCGKWPCYNFSIRTVIIIPNY
jgi:hypothetical protein